MSNIESVIVVGASAAGITCIRQLRNNNFAGTITLIDKDENGAYERPPLSKQVLMDAESKVEDIALITKDELTELNVKTYFGDALTNLDPTSKKITLASGEELSADAIVLATGGEARRLPIKGADLPQVMVIRHLKDAISLREKLTPGTRVAVIGGGFIGAETSASLAKLGADVYWLDAAELPLAHLLPKPLCEKIVANHCEQGVKLTSNCRISKFSEQEDGSISIVYTDESSLNVDAIVLGVGMSPNTAYLSDDLNNSLVNKDIGGIQVNENQETQFSGIYAAGDVAAVTHESGVTVRHEHWQSAQFQGERVAAAILGQPIPTEPVHWFWSDQGDLHIEMAGKILPTEEHLVERLEGDWPVYFSVVDNKVHGAVSVNNPNAVRASMRMIKNDVHVDPEKLADPSIPLRKLMRS